jgi:hypothetical protein
MSGAPSRTLHKLRGGDGQGIPSGPPPELWPDMEELEPYWQSFTSYALSELGTEGSEPARIVFQQMSDGSWRFRASTAIGHKRQEPTGQTYAQTLTYERDEDVLRFEDTRDGSSWVMEDAFGDQLSATSKL